MTQSGGLPAIVEEAALKAERQARAPPAPALPTHCPHGRAASRPPRPQPPPPPTPQPHLIAPQITLLRKAGAAADHPLNPAYPEGQYLTALAYRVL